MFHPPGSIGAATAAQSNPFKHLKEVQKLHDNVRKQNEDQFKRINDIQRINESTRKLQEDHHRRIHNARPKR